MTRRGIIKSEEPRRNKKFLISVRLYDRGIIGVEKTPAKVYFSETSEYISESSRALIARGGFYFCCMIRDAECRERT